MNSRQVLGLLGSILLCIGVFAPIITIPIIKPMSLPSVGTLNLLGDGNGDGTIILVLAGISVLFTLVKKFKWLWLTGLCSAAVILLDFLHTQRISVDHQLELKKVVAGLPVFMGNVLDNLMGQLFQPQWGWAVLIIGVIFLFSSAAISDDSQ